MSGALRRPRCPLPDGPLACALESVRRAHPRLPGDPLPLAGPEGARPGTRFPDRPARAEDEGRARAIRSFFAGGSLSPSRAEFWAAFASRLRRVQAPDEAGLLLLDFGGFGVVEWGRAGRDVLLVSGRVLERLTKKDATFEEIPTLARIPHGPGWRERVEVEVGRLVEITRRSGLLA